MTKVNTAPRLGKCLDCAVEFEHPGRRGEIPKRCPYHQGEWHRHRWRREPKDRRSTAQRKMNLKFRYNLTIEQWDEMFAKQGSVCAICKSDTPNGGNGWSTDHCHATGKVRGVLCVKCNRGLGCYNDNPELLRDAAAYLGEVI